MNFEVRYSIIIIFEKRLSAAIPHFIIRYFLFDILRFAVPTWCSFIRVIKIHAHLGIPKRPILQLFVAKKMKIKRVIRHFQHLHFLKPGFFEHLHGPFAAPHHSQAGAPIHQPHRHAMH
jgi:hypothetical protein